MASGVCTLSVFSLSFSPSLLSCQTRISAGLLGAFVVLLHSPPTVRPICWWMRSEIEGAKERQTARVDEGERREVRKCPLRTHREGAILKSWEQSVSQFPLPHLHYFFFSFHFWTPILFFYALHRNGENEIEFQYNYFISLIQKYIPLPVPMIIPLA